jgi:signal transduction histidine kinase
MADTERSYLQLLALAVHELRTPAGVVEGYLRMLQHSTEPLTERQRKMIDEAERSSARVLALLSELNEIGKFDAGGIALAREPLDFFALVQETVDGLHEPRLHLSGPSSSPRIIGDVARVKSAIHGILQALLREYPSAAIVAAERRLIADKEGQTVAVLLVGDPSRVQRAYESPQDSFNEGRGGAGLVLPLARRIIEAHGGRVWSPAEPGSGAGEPPVLRGPSAAVVALPVSS